MLDYIVLLFHNSVRLLFGQTSQNGDSATLYAVWTWPTYNNLATGCSSTAIGNSFYYNSAGYVKLQDGHCWTRDSQGTVGGNVTPPSNVCPSGTHMPTWDEADTLVDSYPNGAGLYDQSGWRDVTYMAWRTTEYQGDKTCPRIYLPDNTYAAVYGCYDGIVGHIVCIVN